MTELITGIHAQPSFPVEDLTDVNALMLELMLANEPFVEDAHLGMEKISWMYKVGHAVVVASSRRIYDDATLHAINTGVSIYEAMAAIVASETSQAPSGFSVNSVAADLTYTKSDASLIDYTLQAVEHFRTDLPRATDVVLEASKRQHHALRHYALLGAALERQFSMDVLENHGSYEQS
jgi:hypothetical protein